MRIHRKTGVFWELCSSGCLCAIDVLTWHSVVIQLKSVTFEFITLHGLKFVP